MKPFEIYKNQVIVAKETAISKGGEQHIATSDRAAYYLDKICSDNKSQIKFKFEETKIAQGECNTVKQFLKLFKNYCDNNYDKRFPFQTAIRATKMAWPHKPITSEAPWGLTELFGQMPRKAVSDDFLHELSNILGKQFVNSNDLWKQTGKQRDAQYPKGDDVNERYNSETVRGPLMAAAVVDLCHNYTAFQRTLPGAKTVKDFEFPEIVDGKGRPVVIKMPYKKPDGKYFHRDETSSTKPAKATAQDVELDNFLDNA